jgi:hypothetical protein
MGIRFLCPNGHKLNVKAFLAGKRGICPQCDAKFLVPLQSGEMALPVEAVAEAPTPEEVSPATTPEVPTAVEPPPVVPSETLPPAIDQSLPDTWYVRPVSGEQYGPANTELMQSWVAEGRVARDSWVWRTGWDNWKIAHEIFDLLKATPTTAPKVQIDPHQSEESFSPKLGKPRPNSRKERAKRISVALGTLVLVLTGVLALVLWFQS